MLNQDLSLEDLWAGTEPGRDVFKPEAFAHLPEPARRYLEHAIAPGTILANAVRLRMHGEIKLGNWFPFEAEQVISLSRGMIWAATVKMFGLPVKGSDRFIDGEGGMKWKLLGLIPMVTAAGPDISRSAAGRVQAECIWLPSALCDSHVQWTAADAAHPHAGFTLQGYEASLDLTVDTSGRVHTVKLARWGNPEKEAFHEVDFGGVMEEERAFGGYTLPSKVRIGWYFGSERFDTEGEFFRGVVDEAIFR